MRKSVSLRAKLCLY